MFRHVELFGALSQISVDDQLGGFLSDLDGVAAAPVTAILACFQTPRVEDWPLY